MPAQARVTPRQDEVLDHTFALVQEFGVGGVTVRRVAERVGFSEAALYRHFPSKHALLMALMERLGRRLLEPIRAIAEQRNLTPRERLERILGHHVRVVIAAEGIPMLILVEASVGGDSELVDLIRSIVDDYLGILSGLLRQVAPAGGPPPEELSLLLMGLPAATAIRHRLRPDAALERRAAEELARFLIERLTGPDRPTAEEGE